VVISEEALLWRPKNFHWNFANKNCFTHFL